MAKKKDDGHWMERAFANSHGQLRRKTHTRAGHKISSRELTREKHSRNPKTRKQANLAAIARRYSGKRHHRSR